MYIWKVTYRTAHCRQLCAARISCSAYAYMTNACSRYICIEQWLLAQLWANASVVFPAGQACACRRWRATVGAVQSCEALQWLSPGNTLHYTQQRCISCSTHCTLQQLHLATSALRAKCWVICYMRVCPNVTILVQSYACQLMLPSANTSSTSPFISSWN